MGQNKKKIRRQRKEKKGQNPGGNERRGKPKAPRPYRQPKKQVVTGGSLKQKSHAKAIDSREKRVVPGPGKRAKSWFVESESIKEGVRLRRRRNLERDTEMGEVKNWKTKDTSVVTDGFQSFQAGRRKPGLTAGAEGDFA